MVRSLAVYSWNIIQFRSGTGADKKGLGVSEVHNLEAGDDEFEAYRKRMMMAYRFRPNPLVSLSSVYSMANIIDC